jgi:hypothetical protein
MSKTKEAVRTLTLENGYIGLPILRKVVLRGRMFMSLPCAFQRYALSGTC